MQIQRRKYGMQRRVKEYGGKECRGNTEGDVRRGLKSSMGVNRECVGE